MSKIGGFFARKAGLYDTPADPAPIQLTLVEKPAAGPDSNPLEIDEELFSAMGSQFGSDNETLRNLLLDANAKIGELDTIKAAVGRLADPVGKTLRALEAEKSEKVSLQTVLNNTRTAYGKLRNKVADLEAKLAASDAECQTLRQNSANIESQLRTADATTATLTADLSACRAQISDLDNRLAKETGHANALHEQNRRLDEQLTLADKRTIALEYDLNGTRQRLLLADDEKHLQRSMLDKANADVARLARKLAETETALGVTNTRLRQVEDNFTILNTERAQLATSFEEAKESHEREIGSQRMRFDALQARATATEGLLVEAREHLLARAEEIRNAERLAAETAKQRDTLQSMVSELQVAVATKESLFREADESRLTLLGKGAALARAYNGKEAALAQAETAIAAMGDKIGVLQSVHATEKRASEMEIEQLRAALRAEKMERATADGALATARKDLNRLLREVMAMQRTQGSADSDDAPKAANAA